MAVAARRHVGLGWVRGAAQAQRTGRRGWRWCGCRRHRRCRRSRSLGATSLGPRRALPPPCCSLVRRGEGWRRMAGEVGGERGRKGRGGGGGGGGGERARSVEEGDRRIGREKRERASEEEGRPGRRKAVEKEEGRAVRDAAGPVTGSGCWGLHRPKRRRRRSRRKSRRASSARWRGCSVRYAPTPPSSPSALSLWPRSALLLLSLSTRSALGFPLAHSLFAHHSCVQNSASKP
jgi:hypothetical protein